MRMISLDIKMIIIEGIEALKQEPKTPQEKSEESRRVLKDFLKVFLVPTLINKFFMIYFGLNYSNSPGEGYGYGLAGTILFLIFTMARFVWKYKDIEDP